jgi:hypothetical protein
MENKEQKDLMLDKVIDSMIEADYAHESFLKIGFKSNTKKSIIDGSAQRELNEAWKNRKRAIENLHQKITVFNTKSSNQRYE